MKILSSKSVALLAVLISSAFPTYAETRLVFPRVVLQEGHFTGLAIVNPTAGEAQVTLTAYKPDGSIFGGDGVLNPVVQNMGPGTQLARLAAEFFTLPASVLEGASPTYVWVELKSPTDGLTGFFLEGTSTLNALDGADLVGTGTDLVLPLVEVSESAATEISIVNPEQSTANISVDFLEGAGTLVNTVSATVPAHGALQGALQSIFELDYSEVASLRIRSDQPVVGFAFLRRNNESLVVLSAVNRDVPAKTLYFPTISHASGSSAILGIQNTGTNFLLLTLTVHNPDGTLVTAPRISENPVSRTIPPSGTSRIDLKSAFRFQDSAPVSGWLKVEGSEASIVGYLESGSGSNRTITAGQAEAGRRFILAHQASAAPFFTTLSLLNTGTLAANVEVVALKSDNSLAGKGQRVLKPGQRESLSLQEYVPAVAGVSGGSVFVKSDVPVIASQVFGTDTATSVANIPPQRVPDTFDPGAALPKVVVFPPLAVVETSKAQRFTATGATGATWLVNGVEGGSSATGTVTSAGLFTAPKVAPASHTMVVQASASGGAQSAAASVDVIQRETLTAGLTLVTSVAYLVNLERYFIAEQQILSSAQDPRAGEAQAPGISSRIQEQTAAGEVTTFAQVFDTVGKMIPFVDGSAESYLLIAGLESGNVYRLSIATRELKVIASGLSQPNSLALDPVTGDLLVSEGGANRITTIPRTTFDPTLAAAVAAAGESVPALEAGSRRNLAVSSPQGVAFDSCTGAVYVSTSDGVVHEYRGNVERVLATGLDSPSEILVLHRSGVTPCHAGTSLLITTSAGIFQLFPQTGEVLPFLTETGGPQDLTFFPPGNPFTPNGEASVGIADTQGVQGTGRVLQVALGTLYTVESPVPITPIGPFGTDILYIDPVGDTFASDVTTQNGLEEVDLVSIDAQGIAGSVVLTLTLGKPAAPFGDGLPNSLSGFIDLDLVPGRGVPSQGDTYNPLGVSTGLGVDASIDLAQSTISLAGTTQDRAPDQDERAAVSPVEMFFLGNNVVIKIPNASLDISSAKVVVGVGNRLEITDVGPNERFIGVTVDDGTTPTVRFARTSSKANESGDSIPIEVRLSSSSTDPVTVNYALTGGTASQGLDFRFTGGILTFAPGETAKTLSLQVLEDGIREPSETVVITLSSPVNAELTESREYTHTILDNDATPTVRFGKDSSSGSERKTSVSIPISMSNPAASPVTVAYSVTGGTATVEADFAPQTGSVTLEPGETHSTISFTLIDDQIPEASETIIVSMTSIQNAVAGTPSRFTYTVIDDDGEQSLPTVQFEIEQSTSGLESDTAVDILLTLSGPSSSSVVVQIVTSGGTAVFGEDYTIGSSSVTFPPGVTSAVFPLTIVNDTQSEQSETVFMSFGTVSGAIPGSPGSFTYTIVDDDLIIGPPPPNVQFETVSSSLDEDGETVTIVRVILSSPSAQQESVEFAVGGTANPLAGTGQDYVTSPTTFLIFQPGETQKEVWFANEFANPNPPPGTPLFVTLPDSLLEPNETIILTLTLPSGGIVIGSQFQHTFTITDDDTPIIQFASPSSTADGPYSGGIPIPIQLSMSTLPTADVTLTFNVTYIPAGFGSEFTVESSPITIPAFFQFSPVITITPNVSFTGGGQIVVNLTSATGGAVLGTLTSHTLTVNSTTIP